MVEKVSLLSGMKVILKEEKWRVLQVLDDLKEGEIFRGSPYLNTYKLNHTFSYSRFHVLS